MKLALCGLVVLSLVGAPLARLTWGQEVTPNEVVPQQPIGQDGAIRLTLEEQLKLRAAQQKAVDDPAVKAALAKRDEAIEGFRKAMHDSMVKTDPKLEPILAKIAIGSSPGF